MIFASVQTTSKRDDIDFNLNDHNALIDLEFKAQDSKLNHLRLLSVDRQIIEVAGAPVLINNNLFLGAFIFGFDYSISIYAKQFCIQLKNNTLSLSLIYRARGSRQPFAQMMIIHCMLKMRAE